MQKRVFPKLEQRYLHDGFQFQAIDHRAGNLVRCRQRQLSEWIKARFVDESDGNPHDRVATIFANQDYFLESLEDQRVQSRRLPPTPRPSNIRKVDEIPWQLLDVAKFFGNDEPQSPHWNTVADLFTDVQILAAKTEATAWSSTSLEISPTCWPRCRRNIHGIAF